MRRNDGETPDVVPGYQAAEPWPDWHETLGCDSCTHADRTMLRAGPCCKIVLQSDGEDGEDVEPIDLRLKRVSRPWCTRYRAIDEIVRYRQQAAPRPLSSLTPEPEPPGPPDPEELQRRNLEAANLIEQLHRELTVQESRFDDALRDIERWKSVAQSMAHLAGIGLVFQDDDQ